jgi:hypothetical protein
MAIAESKLGAPYVWATAGPDTFDCSGFTWYVASQVLGPLDHELRSSHHQFNVWGDPVADPWPGAVARGDLVFFDTMGVVVMGNRASHVGFALGDGRFIHAANESLGVRIDALASDWYRPKFIGARRIFSSERPDANGSPGTGLRVPAGPIQTPAPWPGGNGQPIGADWSLIGRWAETIEEAARQSRVDPRELAAIMAIETQGVHERDGRVIEVWDHYPQDGPSVGVMQVKPRVWQWLAPQWDAYDAEGNIRLGAAVLRVLIDRHGSFEAVIARGYHPGVSPNGTTPTTYVMAALSLLRELDEASSRPAEASR